MIYRVANEYDLPQIISMKNRVKERIINENLPIWLNDYPADNLLIDDINNHFGRVIAIDDKIIAYAVFLPSSIEYQDYINNIEGKYSFGRVMVDNDYIGIGVGKLLVKSMINEAKSLNQNGMIITADEFNKKAVNLYQSYGFRKIGEQQFPYAYLTIYELKF